MSATSINHRARHAVRALARRDIRRAALIGRA
jgi:hypothetical protein